MEVAMTHKQEVLFLAISFAVVSVITVLVHLFA
jgi:hypothetical protein